MTAAVAIPIPIVAEWRWSVRVIWMMIDYVDCGVSIHLLVVKSVTIIDPLMRWTYNFRKLFCQSEQQQINIIKHLVGIKYIYFVGYETDPINPLQSNPICKDTSNKKVGWLADQID